MAAIMTKDALDCATCGICNCSSVQLQVSNGGTTEFVTLSDRLALHIVHVPTSQHLTLTADSGKIFINGEAVTAFTIGGETFELQSSSVDKTTALGTTAFFGGTLKITQVAVSDPATDTIAAEAPTIIAKSLLVTLTSGDVASTFVLDSQGGIIKQQGGSAVVDLQMSEFGTLLVDGKEADKMKIGDSIYALQFETTDAKAVPKSIMFGILHFTPASSMADGAGTTTQPVDRTELTAAAA